MRFRLLPITITLTGVLMVTKVLSVATSYLNPAWDLQTVILPAAVAAATETLAAQHAPAPTATPAVTARVTEPKRASQPVPRPLPPPTVSDEERQLLQDLRLRKQELDVQSRALVEREGVLSAAEQLLASRAAELSATQGQLEQLERSRVSREDANWVSLVRVYEGMKPRDAATIFNDMDMTVLLELADRIKESKAGPILAAMQPDRARLLTVQLAAKRSRLTAVPSHAEAVKTEGTSHS